MANAKNREQIIKPEGSTPLKVFWREVHCDQHGEYVFYLNRRAYIKRENGKVYIDYYQDK